MRFWLGLLTAIFCRHCAGGVDFYLWQRLHTVAVRCSAENFYSSSSGNLALLAGELERAGRKVEIAPPEFIRFDRSTAVIRVHTDWMRMPPDKLAGEIALLYQKWQRCNALEIDLDCPESRLDYYTLLMKFLRKLLPDDILSATVLPCHLKHIRDFTALAQNCDFYVLQVHGLNREKGHWEIFDYSSAEAAVTQANKLNLPYKTALPLYCNNLSGNVLIKPDLHKVALLAQKCRRVIGFRLGHAEDGNSLDLPTAASICRGQGYHPFISGKWFKQSNGAWIMQLENNGYFAEPVTLSLAETDDPLLLDCGTFGNEWFNRENNTLIVRLPPSGAKKNILWARFKNDCNPNKSYKITIKESLKK